MLVEDGILMEDLVSIDENVGDVLLALPDHHTSYICPLPIEPDGDKTRVRRTRF